MVAMDQLGDSWLEGWGGSRLPATLPLELLGAGGGSERPAECLACPPAPGSPAEKSVEEGKVWGGWDPGKSEGARTHLPKLDPNSCFHQCGQKSV